MKNKIAVTSICLFVAGFFLFYSYNVKQSKLKLAIEPIYQENKVDDQAREHLQRGDTFYQKGQLAMAAEEYKLSYSIGGPSKIICGFKLVEVYEKLNRYGDALSFLDEMEKPSWSKDDHA
ncbi:MAG: hypothetical protein HYT89_04240, partial [Candidatus Omnitrophica bacterium]|nr:hypothetical protein [Candidatus Omnitrophota bacterium]